MENEFNYIRIQKNEISGIIIPKFPVVVPGTRTFTFSVDFGTTNTHIEYKIENESTRPFEITELDEQIGTLFNPAGIQDILKHESAINISELIEFELLPFKIGLGEKYKFPQRTVIAENGERNKSSFLPFAEFNIPFTYEVTRKKQKDVFHANLKWAKKDPSNEIAISNFFESIIILIRNKVVMNNGDLSKTGFIWFYPASMRKGRRDDMGSEWEKLCKKYFNVKNHLGAENDKNLTNSISESMAPFYYYKDTQKLIGGGYKPVVSIDIGGGTSDVVVFESYEPKLISSFKFAANSIFGDAYSTAGAAQNNGLIKKYYKKYEDKLNKLKINQLVDILKELKELNKSEDINEFLFSLQNNPDITDKEQISYNKLLSKDEDLKVIFIYFYSALIYHIAELMKMKNIEMPKNIIFSGMGSKTINILTADLETLAEYTSMIFEDVYNDKYSDEDKPLISIELEKPKEITCKGGLLAKQSDYNININSIKTVLTCLENENITKLIYDELNEPTIAKITTYIKSFNTYFLSLNSKYNFEDNFNASPESVKIMKKILNMHIQDYIGSCIEYNKNIGELDSGDKEISETLFFYPIIGTINNLVNNLTVLNK